LHAWSIRDTDKDGLSDEQEITLGTSVNDVDTDDDDVPDGEDEFPLDPEQWKASGYSVLSEPKIMINGSNSGSVYLQAPAQLDSSMNRVAMDALPKLYVRGDMNNWMLTDELTIGSMDAISARIYLDAGAYTFVIADETWNITFGSTTELSRNVVLGEAVALESSDNLWLYLEIREPSYYEFWLEILEDDLTLRISNQE
jgi:hypothetical protein